MSTSSGELAPTLPLPQVYPKFSSDPRVSVVSYLSVGTNGNGASTADLDNGAAHTGGKDGMRREWNFLLQFQHQAARASLQVSPLWDIRFIDPEMIQKALQESEDDVPVEAPPSSSPLPSSEEKKGPHFSSSSEETAKEGEVNRLVLERETVTESEEEDKAERVWKRGKKNKRRITFIPFLKYGDTSAFSSDASKPNPKQNKAAEVVVVEESPSRPEGEGEASYRNGGDDKVWLDKVEQVEMFYSNLREGTTLRDYCVSCVQHVLQDPHVVAIDGDKDLRHLKVGDKLRCTHLLSGYQSFQFYASVQVQSRSPLSPDTLYATGVVGRERGYLFLVRGGDEKDLEDYVDKIFLPYFTKLNRLALEVEVTYRKASVAILEDQQRLYGEFTYQDRDAAISVSLPMYAMRIRPDYSPVKTVDVGSIACMTLELSVYERLIDDAAVAEITGMPKHKVSRIVLTLDVEDVSRMGYPNVMSAEQYSELKTKRILEVYSDAKGIGMPTSVQMGRRTGRSRIVSFTYEPFHSVVKGMFSSTLVGNYSVTALYLTGLGGGAFDTHLFTYQHFLNSIVYYQQSVLNKKISRHQVVNIRLTEQDLPRAYAEAPEGEREVMKRHIELMRLSNDGRADNAVEVPVPPDEGGVAPSLPAAFNHSTTTAAQLHERRSMFSGSMLSDTQQRTLLQQVAQRASTRGGSTSSGELSLGSASPLRRVSGDSSFHSDSDISIGNVPRLQGEVMDEEDTLKADDSLRGVSTVDSQRRSTFSSTDLPFSGIGSPLLRGRYSNSSYPNSSGFASPDGPSSRRVSLASAQVPSTADLEAAQKAVVEERQKEQKEEERKLVQRVLAEDDDGMYFAPSLKDVYLRCCGAQGCKPNSHLLSRLPTDGRFTTQVEEIDLTSSYLGHPGFLAVLQLLDHLPSLRRVYFKNMSLDNQDAKALCEYVASHPSLSEIYLENNPNITLPSTKYFQRLLQENHHIRVLSLQGTKMGSLVIEKLEREAKEQRQSSLSSR